MLLRVKQSVYQTVSQSGPNGKMTPDNEQALKRERRRSKNRQPVFTALVTTWDYLTAVNRLNSSDGANLHQLD